MKKKVVVGMSGGVDSFTAAWLLREQGYEVVGVNLQLWGESDTREVERICRELHIPLLFRTGREVFRKRVVDAFVREYLHGRTPSPCCVCNRRVKWELLAEVAGECGAERIATGHYVRIQERDGRHYVLKGRDPAKDQSYFLWGVPPQILARALVPLGEYTKAEVKALASRIGYGTLARKRESMGVCFLEGRDYREVIAGLWGTWPGKAGNIVDRQGRVLGTHTGIFQFTIGQKQGLPSREGRPLYVAAIDAVRNEVVADEKAGLFTGTLLVSSVEAVDRQELFLPDVTVKIRGLGLNPSGPVRMEEQAAGKLRVHLSSPAWAAAPGQPVAFYRGDVLIGGGILCAPLPS